MTEKPKASSEGIGEVLRDLPSLSLPQFVVPSFDSLGRLLWMVMLPSPHGPEKSVAIIYDWFKHPEVWEERRPLHLAGESPDMQEVLMRNFLANTRLGFEQDWKKLYGAEKGKTAIILSCGPSISDDVEEIKKLRMQKDKYFTIGFNRAGRLMNLDYFVSVDRRAKSRKDQLHQDWMDQAPGKNCKLISSTTGCPDIVSMFEPAQRYWGESMIGGLDAGNARMATGLGITLCETMNVAARLGASELLLYGCDFAIPVIAERDAQGLIKFTETKYYFDVSASDGLALRRSMYTHEWIIRGKDGSPIAINYELIANCAYMQCMATMLRHNGITVTDKTKSGIPWDGGARVSNARGPSYIR